MKDENRTKSELIRELKSLRRQVKKLNETKGRRKQTEEALCESEDRYRDLVENSQNLICTHDLKGRILSANPWAAKVLGYEMDTILQMNIRDFLAPEVREGVDAYLAKIRERGTAKGLLLVQNAAGERRIWEYNNTLRTEGVAFPLVRGVAHDITERKLAEKMMKESEKKYRMIFDKTPIGVVISTIEGKIIDLNKAQAEMIGGTVEELKGRSVNEYCVYPDKRREMIELFKKTGKVHDFEMELKKKDGSIIVELLNLDHIKIGGKDYLFSMGRDITKPKQAEEDLRRVTEDAHAILWRAKVTKLENETDDCAGFSWDTHYLNLDAVNKFMPLQNHPSNDLSRMLHFSVLAEDRKAMDQCSSGALKLGANSYTQEFRLCDANGIIHWMYEDARIKQLSDTQFEVIGFITDITERKQTEEKLQRSEIQYRSLTENSPDLIAQFDRQYRHLYVNHAAAKAGRYSPYEYVGKTIAEVGIPEEEAMKWEERIRTAFETGQVVDVEDSFETPNGSRNFHTKFVPEFTPDGSIHSVQSIARDITKRKRAEEASKRTEEEIRKSHIELRMLANHLQNIREEERKHMAREFHDQLGQSLTALKMDLSLLLRMISDEKQDVQRKLIIEELQSMQKIVDETSQLVWAIITELRPQMLDDLGLVTTFEWEAQQFASHTGISCEFKSSAEDIQIDSERSIALFRIYQEALTNIRCHANATVVKSVLRKDNEVLVLEIKDNGCGIALDKQSKTKSFGIIDMRERALVLGGSLEISGAAGEGTTVIVRLPLEQVAKQESKDK